MTWLAPLLCTTLDLRAVEIARSLRQQHPSDGDHVVRAWEQRFGRWLARGHVRACASGRGALYAVTRALGLGPGDGVVVPAFTCQSVLNAFHHAGVQTQAADIETQTFGLDVDATRAAITPSTRALMVQHSFGLAGRDLEALLSLARERRLLVIEDCAHALGGRSAGRPLGSLGDAAIFSFERGKVLTTVHGGMAVVQGEAAAQRLDRCIGAAPFPSADDTDALLASVEHDYWTLVGTDSGQAEQARTQLGPRTLPRMWPEEFEGRFCSIYAQRMSAPVAALADSQFDRLEEVLAMRRAQAAHWMHWARRAGLPTARVPDGSQPAWLRFPVWASPALKADPSPLEASLGVEVGLWFTSPSHPVPSTLGRCPRGMAACASVVNLPTLLPAGHPHRHR